MGGPKVSLMDAHGALSHLVFAVNQALEPYAVDVWVEWRNATDLTLYVECRPKRVQLVIDRLLHGILHGPYNYRFRMVGHPPMEAIAKMHQDFDWVTVSASPDLSHDMNLFQRKAA